MNNINHVKAVLAAALQDERTFAEAHALYCESFKCDSTFTVADGFYAREDLVDYLMSPIHAPVPEQFKDDDWFEPELIKQGLSREHAEAIVDECKFVETCNYKGEGEGFELYERVAHLRTFFSKHNYA